MAERKKQKTKRREKNKDNGNEPTKEEYAVAKFVRFNCPTKSTLIMGNDMHYFTASKAVDCLLSSKWASDKAKEKLFSNRQTCVDYMQRFIDKGLLFRAKKLVPKRKDRPGEVTAAAAAKDQGPQAVKGAKIAEETKRKDSQEKSPKKEKRRRSVDDLKEREEKEKNEDEDKNKKDAKKKPKKVKFEIHQQQLFIDGNDIYVWKYDPTSTKTFILGLGIVIGAIGVCLFPLWPPQLRLGVYYLSLVAMGFVGVIVALVVLRSILFGAIWVGTWGKHHFWLLPNLTEDCGFFESFKPLYSHKISEGGEKKRKKSKSSDKEDEESGDDKEKDDDVNTKESEDDEATKNAPTDSDRASDEEGERKEERRGVDEEESHSENDQEENGSELRRRKKNSNGFEMVDVDGEEDEEEESEH